MLIVAMSPYRRPITKNDTKLLIGNNFDIDLFPSNNTLIHNEYAARSIFKSFLKFQVFFF